MIKKITGLIGWIFVFQLIGYGLGLLTKGNITSWYAALEKSSLTPPDVIFPIVWSILYVGIALSGWSLWQQRKKPKAKLALSFFSAQMVLNWAWTPVFFYFHQLALGFYCIILMICLTFATILITKNNFKFSCILLTPYLLWLFFACYLNGVIWLLN